MHVRSLVGKADDAVTLPFVAPFGQTPPRGIVTRSLVLRARPDSQTCQGMGAGWHRHQVRRGVVGLRADAGSMAEGRRRARPRAGEAGLSRHISWPRAAGSGSHPVVGDITEFFHPPFLRDPNRYR